MGEIKFSVSASLTLYAGSAKAKRSNAIAGSAHTNLYPLFLGVFFFVIIFNRFVLRAKFRLLVTPIICMPINWFTKIAWYRLTLCPFEMTLLSAKYSWFCLIDRSKNQINGLNQKMTVNSSI